VCSIEIILYACKEVRRNLQGCFPAWSTPLQSFIFTYLLLNTFTSFIAYQYDANIVINQVSHAHYSFLSTTYFILDRKQTSQLHPLQADRMADTEQKVDDDVLVGEEEGNDEVLYSSRFHCRTLLIKCVGGDFRHEEEGCRDGRGGSQAS
jgi:hypothetical protein